MKKCRVLKVFYKCLMIIQYESKHAAVQGDIRLEIELCLTDAICLVFLLPEHYRVIHKSLRDFRTRLRNNQDRHGRKEHINR